MNKQRKANEEVEYLHWKRQGKIAMSDFIGVVMSHPRFGGGRIVDYDRSNEMATIDTCISGGDGVIHLKMNQLLGEDSRWEIIWKYMDRRAKTTNKFWIGRAMDDTPPE
jgi:hypothetical protein